MKLRTNIDIDRLDEMSRLTPEEREEYPKLIDQLEARMARTEDEDERQSLDSALEYLSGMLNRKPLRQALEEMGCEIQIERDTEGNA